MNILAEEIMNNNEPFHSEYAKIKTTGEKVLVLGEVGFDYENEDSIVYIADNYGETSYIFKKDLTFL